MAMGECPWRRRAKISSHIMSGGDARCGQITEHVYLPIPSRLLPPENESVRGLPRTHFKGEVLSTVPKGHFLVHGPHVEQPLHVK